MKALLLIRSPFQGWLATMIIGIDKRFVLYDLIYITQSDSAEDQSKYSSLSANAVSSVYVFQPKLRPDFLNHIMIKRAIPRSFFSSPYGSILLSSVDCPVVNSIATLHRESLLFTFDDGITNIFSASLYRTGCLPFRSKILHLLLGASPIRAFNQRVCKHYTLFPFFKSNIAPEKLAALDMNIIYPKLRSSNHATRFFIGQPFHEFLSPAEINLLRKHFANADLDYYIKHPRERNALLEDLPMFEKRALLAEEAILSLCPGRIEVFGCTSATLYLLNGYVSRSVSVLPSSMVNLEAYKELADLCGLAVHLI